MTEGVYDITSKQRIDQDTDDLDILINWPSTK